MCQHQLPGIVKRIRRTRPTRQASSCNKLPTTSSSLFLQFEPSGSPIAEDQYGLYRLTLSQDFHFGFLATIDYTSDRLRGSVFPILSIPSDSSGRGRGPALPRPGTENPEVPHSKRFLRHLSVPSFLRPVCFSAAAPYPVSKGSAAIRRS